MSAPPTSTQTDPNQLLRDAYAADSWEKICEAVELGADCSIVDDKGHDAGLIILSHHDRRTPAVSRFVKAGGKFSDKVNGDGFDAGLLLANTIGCIDGDIIKEFIKGGGIFSDKVDEFGFDAGMIFALRARAAVVEGIEAKYAFQAVTTFLESGGKFSDQISKEGGPRWNAALLMAYCGARGIELFAKHGYKFNNHCLSNGRDAGMIAASFGAEGISAFIEAGGKFSDAIDTDNYDTADYAIMAGSKALLSFTHHEGQLRQGAVWRLNYMESASLADDYEDTLYALKAIFAAQDQDVLSQPAVMPQEGTGIAISINDGTPLALHQLISGPGIEMVRTIGSR